MPLPRRRFLLTLPLVAALPIAWSLRHKSSSSQLANLDIIRDVEYGKGGGRALKLHVLRPNPLPPEPMPGLVWIHGGGWQEGNKDSGIAILEPFARRGYLCASIEYRFSQEAIFPAQIQDCKCAVRFLRANATKYHLDVDRIGVWGFSAGGHLAALLGTSGNVKPLEGTGGWQNQSSQVQAVCAWSAPTDLLKFATTPHPRAQEVLKALLGGTVAQKATLAKAASPIAYVTPDDPPFFILHGEKDNLVPVQQSQLLHNALRQAGVPSTLSVIPNAGHVFDASNEDVFSFFEKSLNT